MSILFILVIIPLLFAAFMLFFRREGVTRWVNVFYAICCLAFSLKQLTGMSSLAPYFKTDSLNLIFLFILAIVYLNVALYTVGYFKRAGYQAREEMAFSLFFLLFTACMIAAILSTHLVLLWVFIEGTTLASAYLIYVNKTRASLEAAWKYVFICSIGIALSYIGIVFLSAACGANCSLFFHDLYESALNMRPFWLKIAFVFMVIGFGTKMGLAPTHSWLPDAHSEAPSPISAMLSGVLLNVSFLAILRVIKIMELAEIAAPARQILLAMGMLSMLIGSVYISRAVNYKRLLAYSSIENMGIMAIGIGTGPAGTYAALLHMLSHSLSKSGLFLTSGNMITLFKSKKISDIKGLLRKDKITGWLLLILFFAISGLPPFPGFFSELLIIKALLGQGSWWIALLVLGYLLIIVYFMGNKIFKMIFSQPHEPESPMTLDRLHYLPQLLLIVCLLVLGIYMPDFIFKLLKNASDLIG